MKVPNWQESYAYVNMATVDAAPKLREPIIASKLIDLHVLSEIEKDLERYEQLCCLFFLIDDYTLGYDKLVEIQNNEQSLSKFVRDNAVEDWQEKLMEGLCLVQNNEILLKLGVNSEDAHVTFSTRISQLSYKINKYAKLFYRLFDGMTKKDARTLLDRVYQDRAMSLPDCQTWPEKVSLELHLLWWIKNGFIRITNDQWSLQKLLSILKELNMSGSIPYRALQDCDNNDNNLYSSSYQADNMSNIRLKKIENNDDTKDDVIDKYEINNGLVIIFNQMNFPRTKHEYRYGSKEDCSRIKDTFEKHFGFEVETYHDCGEKAIYAILDGLSYREKKYDCVTVFILSHGIYGKIIASDGAECRIEDIKSKLCCMALKNKPKILVIQACQKHDKDLTTDSPKIEPDVGRFEDFLGLNSTIPGEFSVRDRQHGTWFIQVLCEQLVKMKGKSIDEVLTKVNSCFKTKIAEVDGTLTKQVPERLTSLAKVLIFPCRRGLPPADSA